jgi:hypothetical protein
MRMKTYLRNKAYERKMSGIPVQLYAWVKCCWRPIRSYRVIARGKRKGQFMVTLYNDKQRVSPRIIEG